MDSIPTRNGMFNIFISSLCCRRKALSSATQYEMPPEFGGIWGEFLNTRLSLSTYLHAGYSVKLKKNNIYVYTNIHQNTLYDE